MICDKHGEVGKPLSNGHCVKCEREMIGKEGIELLAVLFDIGKPMKTEDAVNEVNRRLNNEEAGIEK